MQNALILQNVKLINKKDELDSTKSETILSKVSIKRKHASIQTDTFHFPAVLI